MIGECIGLRKCPAGGDQKVSGSGVGVVGLVRAAHPFAPVRDIQSFIAYSKAQVDPSADSQPPPSAMASPIASTSSSPPPATLLEHTLKTAPINVITGTAVAGKRPPQNDQLVWLYA